MVFIQVLYRRKGMNDVYLIFAQMGLFALVIESALKAFFSVKIVDKYILKGTIGDYISKPLFAIIVSLVLCFNLRFDILSELVNGEVSNIGIILTALTVSRGSNGFAEFMERRKKMKELLDDVKVEQIKNGK